jgi:5-methylcytosine-specific restriction protein A
MSRESKYKPVAPFYRTQAWELARAEALARDNFLCQRCLESNILTRADTVHHVETIEDRPDLVLVLENLVSVCRTCHNTIHKRGRTWRRKVPEPRKRRARIIKG